MNPLAFQSKLVSVKNADESTGSDIMNRIEILRSFAQRSGEKTIPKSAEPRSESFSVTEPQNKELETMNDTEETITNQTTEKLGNSRSSQPKSLSFSEVEQISSPATPRKPGTWTGVSTGITKDDINKLRSELWEIQNGIRNSTMEPKVALQRMKVIQTMLRTVKLELDLVREGMLLDSNY